MPITERKRPLTRSTTAKPKTAVHRGHPAPAPLPKRKSRALLPKHGPILLVGTRKGAFLFRGDRDRRTWTLDGPHHLGATIHHVVQDPRRHEVMLMAAKTGHLGPTVFRSLDGGRTWNEARRPPAFPKVDGAAADGGKARAVEFVSWLTPGPAASPGRWYAGTSPFALFISDDSGETWDFCSGFDAGVASNKDYAKFLFPVPEGGMTHSLLVDPRDGNHLYAALSVGGVFESRDTGATWTPLNRGIENDFNPDPDTPVGQDPHCVALHPQRPDRLYQQNHCGIYRCDRTGDPADDRWHRIGRNMPKEVGDIGFPIVLHPRDPDTAWVFPMDGTSVWPRTSPEGKPAAYCTKDAGASWIRQDRGLPPRHAWLTVKRLAFCHDGRAPLGLYFGTTSGAIFASVDEGRMWTRIAEDLPHIFSVTAAEPTAGT
jgi:photosystem II stability/assembly factor-like uncharacterized protein